MNLPTLVLNQYMVPHRVCTWQDAITELYTGKVEILAEYDEIIYHNEIRGLTIKKPAVARLLKPVSAFKKGIKFSRINVMARDDWKCCFCGSKLPMDQLTYDHVVPRVQGGKTVWENIATACKPCNHRKGSRTPEQAKMRLLRKPYKPKTLPLAQPVLLMKKIPDEWLPFTATASAM